MLRGPRRSRRLSHAQVTFDIGSPSFTLGGLLRLELHKFEDEVVDIVDRSQKEEKLEQARGRQGGWLWLQMQLRPPSPAKAQSWVAKMA